MLPFRCPVPICAALVLAGCGAERVDTPPAAAVDPATRLALEAPLLIDPDLTTQSRRFAVMSGPAPLDGSLPPDDFASATAAAARAEARALSGPPDNTALAEVPCPACTAPTLAQRSAVLGKGCDGRFVADMAQGARMPQSLPIYPRAHLREAGTGQGGCAVRAASFTVPADAAAALAFYRAMATRSGFALRAARGGTAVIGQRAGDGARFAAIARPQPGGVSQIDLITAGF